MFQIFIRIHLFIFHGITNAQQGQRLTSRKQFKTTDRYWFRSSSQRKMFSSNLHIATLRRNLPASQHFKPLAAFWRSQKTEAAPLERNETFGDSTSEDGGVRPFEDMPGPKKSLKSIVNVYRKSEGLTKSYKLSQSLFAKYGPIFKENMLGFNAVHIMDPDDFERVFRAEGKYPRRPVIDALVEHRERRNYSRGIIIL